MTSFPLKNPKKLETLIKINPVGPKYCYLIIDGIFFFTVEKPKQHLSQGIRVKVVVGHVPPIGYTEKGTSPLLRYSHPKFITSILPSGSQSRMTLPSQKTFGNT